MENILSNMEIKIQRSIYLKDPNDSELGKRILQEGHIMLNEMGFENFTFKKLAIKLKTTESSVYRYFESKHHFLMYLLNWYWSYLEYHIVFSTLNTSPPQKKLKKVIDILCQNIQNSKRKEFFDISKIQRITVNESAKAYLVNEVDKKNKEGYYLAYKRLCKRISDIICEISPEYKHASSLAVTVVEAISQQKFYAEHLPSLSSFNKNYSGASRFFYQLVLSAISKH
ncbi:MAG: TetR/AcrR family transcriptional regulator [Bacteroidota bacterium]|jgi:AcrR family transcriptional regulator